jgi:hypothetical protein
MAFDRVITVRSVADKLGNDPVSAQYKQHIQRALDSEAANLVLPRTLDDAHETLGSAGYLSGASQLTTLPKHNCHIGQRKLALGLIDFMTLSSVKHGGAPLFVVYPGASIMACLAAHQIFPTARFLCFDPEFKATVPNVKNELRSTTADHFEKVAVIRGESVPVDDVVRHFTAGKPIVVLTDGAGMYGDASHDTVKIVYAQVEGGAAAKRSMIYCSDIRRSGPDAQGGDPPEDQIAEEMVSQALWAKALGVECLMFKMRLPFPKPDGSVPDDLYAIYRTFCEGVDATFSDGSRMAGRVGYLDGECRLQAYARQTSAEMRLISTNGVRLKAYDLKRVEETMAAFNNVYRSFACFKPDVAVPAEYAAHMQRQLTADNNRCMSFDAVAEACILYAAHQAAVDGAADEAPAGGAIRCADAFASLFAPGRHPRDCRAGTEAKVARGHKGHAKSKPPMRKKSDGGPRSDFTPAFGGGGRKGSAVHNQLAWRVYITLAVMIPVVLASS